MCQGFQCLHVSSPLVPEGALEGKCYYYLYFTFKKRETESFAQSHGVSNLGFPSCFFYVELQSLLTRIALSILKLTKLHGPLIHQLLETDDRAPGILISF